ncbi:MAG: hypothetical protein Tsb0021_02960 [Chlamydiales bacterium]
MMRHWISWQIACDKNYGIAMGFDYCYLNQLINFLTQSQQTLILPSTNELHLIIEVEILRLIDTQEIFSNACWDRLKKILKIDSRTTVFNKGAYQRIHSLADQLARLFQKYSVYGKGVIEEWQSSLPTSDWQICLWNKVFDQKNPWTQLVHFMAKRRSHQIEHGVDIHLFGLSWIPPIYIDFFSSLKGDIEIHHYLLSPCQEFWSDMCSDHELSKLKENTILNNHWDVEALFYVERHPFLANSGKLGRMMARIIEEHDGVHVLEHYEDKKSPLNHLLHHVQRDFLHLRTLNDVAESGRTLISEEDDSITIHQAPSKSREIEILYQLILETIEKNRDKGISIYPNEILVMAPNIQEYASYIHSVFGNDESQLDYHIYDENPQTVDSAVAALRDLFSLVKGHWNREEIFRFFEHPIVQESLSLHPSAIDDLKEWAEKAYIHWGMDGEHQQKHVHFSEQEEYGSWEKGIFRLLAGSLITQKEVFHELSPDPFPVEGVSLNKGEILGNWFFILRTLFQDLAPLMENQRMPLGVWVDYLQALFSSYFKGDTPALTALLKQLRSAVRFLEAQTVTWVSIENILLKELENSEIVNYENKYHGLSFASLFPMRAIPAQVIVLLGMEQGFPKCESRDSLDLFEGKKGIDIPKTHDYDRYAFIETLISVRRRLIISYTEEGGVQTKAKQNLSPIVQELMDYLDAFYCIGSNYEDSKMPSEHLFKKHPFSAYDPVYFSDSTEGVVSYSQDAFCIAKVKQSGNKSQYIGPLSELMNKCSLNQQPVDEPLLKIESLFSHAKSPLKTYYQNRLGIVLKKEYESQDEFIISPLNRYLTLMASRRCGFEAAFERAKNQGIVPKSLLRHVSVEELNQDFDAMTETFKTFHLSEDSFVNIHFDPHVEQISPSEYEWTIPAPKLYLAEDVCVVLTGTLANVTEKGLVLFGNSKTGVEYTYWVHGLLMHFLPEQFEKRLIFCKNQSQKNIFHVNAEDSLKRYLEFYFSSKINPSLLYPELIKKTIDLDYDAFKAYLTGNIKSSFGIFCPYLEKTFSENEVYVSQNYFENQKNIAQRVFNSHEN